MMNLFGHDLTRKKKYRLRKKEGKIVEIALGVEHELVEIDVSMHVHKTYSKLSVIPQTVT